MAWSWLFWGILGTHEGAGEELLVRSGDPKSVIRSFSRADEGTSGLLVSVRITLSSLVVSIGHLAAQGAPEIGQGRLSAKLEVTEDRNATI